MMFKDAEQYGQAWQSRLAKERLEKAAPALLEALDEITEMYCRMINSGDCGNWNPEEDKEVIKSRAAIAAAKGE